MDAKENGQKSSEKKWVNRIKIALFTAVMTFFFAVGLFMPLRPTQSVLEKRTLTEFPAFTWDSFWDGSYFSQISTWYADTYPMREGMIASYQSMQTVYGLRSDQIVGDANVVADEIPDITETDPAMGAAEEETASAVEEISSEQIAEQEDPAEPEDSDEEDFEDGTVSEIGELAGSIYITNNCGYDLYYFSREKIDGFAAAVNESAQRIGDKAKLYVMTIPCNSGIMLDENVLEDMGCSDAEKSLEYLYSRISDDVGKVNIYDNLKKHNAEYIYFHTDHHWTALGAYYAYQVFCEEKGITPHDLEDFETMEIDHFMGSYYSQSNQSPQLSSNPDTITAYIPNGTNEMSMQISDGSLIKWNIINDVSSYESGEKYSAFSGADNPFSYAHNETITDGSSILVLKDSYGNAFIPWLIDHYEYVYWVDVRYSKDTLSGIEEDYGNIDDVLICLNMYLPDAYKEGVTNILQ